MSQAPDAISDFLAKVRAIERAWALLDGPAPSAADIEEAIRLGGGSAHVLIRAAELLDDPARAHRLLEKAVTLDAPPAPAQLALSRSFRARGEEEEASRWLRGAMLRARPDAALLLELAAIETDHAPGIVAAAADFPCHYHNAATAADAASALVAYGKLPEARIAGTMAFQAGAREADFLTLYSDLLANPGLVEGADLPAGPLGMPHAWVVGTNAAQARLAWAYPAAPLIARAEAREGSAQWVANERIGAFLKDRIAAAAPFSWIRLGDGEARFLMHLHPALRAALPAREADAMARQIWFAWFGQDLDAVPQADLAAIGERLEQAIRNADLLGVTSATRLAADEGHYGFCAGLEAYLAPVLAERPDAMLSDALAPVHLNRQDPFLGSLLRGLDFLGVVSPHPDLAGRLGRYLGIGTTASYDVPGETRLARAAEAGNRGTHFPEAYQRVLDTLSVPRPGAVFLVAGGLLGKIYCDRIRELGGIALDIGAIADAWAGHNSRGRLLEQAPALPA